jgi:hypothetical protein
MSDVVVVVVVAQRSRPAARTRATPGSDADTSKTNRFRLSASTVAAAASTPPRRAIGRREKRINCFKDSVDWLSVPSYAVRLSRVAAGRTDGG